MKMKKFILEFIRRGLIVSGIGPIVLAILYLILQKFNVIHQLTVSQVCTGIFSLYSLAFIAGGMNAIYQIEQLPLMLSIFIHGSVLYISYLITYLLNSWLEWGSVPVLVFSGIFIIGYFVIWIVIYSIIKKNTQLINNALKKNQTSTD